MILSFSNNELITSYESERVPSNSIQLHTTSYDKNRLIWHTIRFSIQLVAFDILSDRVSLMRTIVGFPLVPLIASRIAEAFTVKI